MNKLTPRQIAVLRSIVEPSEDDEPFPPANTLKALARRGLIAFQKAHRDRSVEELSLSLMGMLVVVPTEAGRRIISEATP